MRAIARYVDEMEGGTQKSPNVTVCRLRGILVTDSVTLRKAHGLRARNP